MTPPTNYRIGYRNCPTCGKPDERWPMPSVQEVIKNCRLSNSTQNERDAADYLEKLLKAARP